MILHETTAPEPEVQSSDYEIERGKPMPGTVHAYVQANLLVALTNLFNSRYTILPELSLQRSGLTPPTVPDLAIYPKFKIDIHQDTIRRTDMPLGVVEILSPSQNLDDMLGKATAFLLEGVQSVWIVVPPLEGVFVYRAPNRYDFYHGNDTLRDERLDIELPLSAIFGARG